MLVAPLIGRTAQAQDRVARDAHKLPLVGALLLRARVVVHRRVPQEGEERRERQQTEDTGADPQRRPFHLTSWSSVTICSFRDSPKRGPKKDMRVSYPPCR